MSKDLYNNIKALDKTKDINPVISYGIVRHPNMKN